MTVLYVFIALVFGAYATSTAEYLLQYNLVDLTLDKIKGIFGTVEKDAKATEQDLLKKFKNL